MDVEGKIGRGAAPNVFDFLDYRAFLKEIYQYKKSHRKKYTLSSFASALGFSSHAGLAMILNGQRELRLPYIEKCSKYLKLNLKERLYLEAMVNNGELTRAKKESLLREIKLLECKWSPPASSNEFQIVDFCLVHQILCLYHRFLTKVEIQQRLAARIQGQDLSRILKKMVENKVAQVNESGAYKIVKSTLIIEDEIPNASGKQLHREAIELALKSLYEDPIEKREFQTYLMTMDASRIADMKLKIKRMVHEIISDFESDLDSSTVVQLHFSMVNLLGDQQ